MQMNFLAPSLTKEKQPPPSLAEDLVSRRPSASTVGTVDSSDASDVLWTPPAEDHAKAAVLPSPTTGYEGKQEVWHWIRSMFPQSPSAMPSQPASAVKAREPTLEAKWGRLNVRVGSGASAQVWVLKRCASSQECVAVKRFRKQAARESARAYGKKLFSEFCINHSLRHENIVDTYDLIRDEKQRLCMVMEYMPGGDLSSRVRHGDLGKGEAMCYFKQLLQGVAYLHSTGVAHRDIKLENLMLSADGRRLKITDFGVADVFLCSGDREPLRSAGMCGSAPYIAPEQYTRELYHAPKADVWSCGIVLYILLRYTLLWRQANEDDTDYRVFRHARQVIATSPTNIGREGGRWFARQFGGYAPIDRVEEAGARQLIYSILEPDPTQRPSADQLLQHELLRQIAWCGDLKHGDRSHVHPTRK
ncbi:uncharacterized protein VTP21DRAFT_2075 [Calcarisporiella thermophila]|uniref:uncharacterized protein n=1 Tax=Calcarisporiella thermophila TaxID=911321 RepID=UPI00374403D7